MFSSAGILRLIFHQGNSAVQPSIRLIIAILMLGNSAALLIAGLALAKQKRLYLFFALTILSINIFLTFTDQLGLFDFLTLLFDSSC